MKNKIPHIINTNIWLVSFCILFLPIDFFFISLTETVLLLVYVPLLFFNYYFFNKRKIFLYIIFFVIALLSNFIFFVLSRVSYFTIYWKLNLIFYFIPTTLLMCFSVKVISDSKIKLIIVFVFILTIISIKSVFFPCFYLFDGGKDCLEDIRDFNSRESFYKVVGLHRLKRNRVDALPKEKIDIIFDVLRNSNWISDSYPNSNYNVFLLSKEYISQTIKYDFSLINYYNLNRVDIYKLHISAEKEKIDVYIPYGEFILLDEEVSTYMEYTTHQPNCTSLYCFSDLFIPFYDRDWYNENMKD